MTRPVPIKPHPITSLIPALILAIASAVSPLIHAEEAVVIGNWSKEGNICQVKGRCSAAFRVDLVTGKRTMISDFTEADYNDFYKYVNSTYSSIPQQVLDRSGHYWTKVAISSSGEIYVYSLGEKIGSGIFRISPTDGSRHLISYTRDIASGPLLAPSSEGPSILAITPTNQILAGIRNGKLVSINPVSGQRKMLSDSSIPSQGPTDFEFKGVDPSGRLWGASSEGIVQIDANSGLRALLSGPTIYTGAAPFLLMNAANSVFGIEDSDTGPPYGKNLYQFKYEKPDPANPLSDFRNPSQGPVIENTVALSWDKSGSILLLDDGNRGTVSLGGLYAVDTATGNRTLISNFSDPSQGPLVYSYEYMDLAVGTMPAFVGNGGGGGNTGGNGGGGSSSGTEPIVSNAESADPVQTGQPFSYTVSFTNYAASVATSVKLSDTLPKKSKLVSAVASQGKCKGKAPVVCNFGTVASGANVTATFTVTRKKTGQVKNSAVLTYKMIKAGTKKKKNYKLAISETTTVN